MRKQIRHLTGILAIGLLLMAANFVLPQKAVAQACLSNAQASQAIKNNQASPLAQVREAVRLPEGSTIVSAQLCQGQDGLIYVLSVLTANGAVENLVVPAR